MDFYGFSNELVPEIVPSFGIQGELSEDAADFLKLKKGIPISYRAGDQPNNAFSLNVLNPGEVAATAGTSGVGFQQSGFGNDGSISHPSQGTTRRKRRNV